MSRIKNIFLSPIFFFLILLPSLFLFYYFFTGGVCPKNFLACSSFDAAWEIEGLPPSEEMEKILSQKFSYLGQGGQSFVFESEDKKTVLKFPKRGHFSFKSAYSNLPAPNVLKQYWQKKTAAANKSLFQYLTSQKIGFEKLKNECALVYVHINPTAHLSAPIVIQDKMHRSYAVDLNNQIFILQKKIVPFQEVFKRYSKNNDQQNMQLLLSKMVDFHASILQRCCIDTDQGFYKNYGILHGQVICFDTGNLAYDSNLKYAGHFNSRFDFIFRKTRIWLQKNRKELSLFLEENIQSKSQKI